MPKKPYESKYASLILSEASWGLRVEFACAAGSVFGTKWPAVDVLAPSCCHVRLLPTPFCMCCMSWRLCTEVQQQQLQLRLRLQHHACIDEWISVITSTMITRICADFVTLLGMFRADTACTCQSRQQHVRGLASKPLSAASSTGRPNDDICCSVSRSAMFSSCSC